MAHCFFCFHTCFCIPATAIANLMLLFFDAAVALSYSMQIVEDGSIGVTSDDIPVDALVCPAGVIYTNEVGKNL